MQKVFQYETFDNIKMNDLNVLISVRVLFSKYFWFNSSVKSIK